MAGTITVKSGVVFTSSASAPSTLTAGGTATISLTVTETGPIGLSNANVELQIFNASNSAVATQVWSSQNFTAGQSLKNSYSWTPATSLPAGAYTVQVGVFDSTWATDYYWNTDATITLTGTKPLLFTSAAKAALHAGRRSDRSSLSLTVTETGTGSLTNGNVELQIYNVAFQLRGGCHAGMEFAELCFGPETVLHVQLDPCRRAGAGNLHGRRWRIRFHLGERLLLEYGRDNHRDGARGYHGADDYVQHLERSNPGLDAGRPQRGRQFRPGRNVYIEQHRCLYGFGREHNPGQDRHVFDHRQPTQAMRLTPRRLLSPGPSWCPAGPPAVVSLSPNAGLGTSVTFTAVYSDPNGAGDLSEVVFLMNSGFASANACYVKYQVQANLLYLSNNAGNAWVTPAVTPGGTGTASNGQCTLNAGTSTVATAGNNLTLNVALSFAGTFVSSRNVYLYAAGLSGQNSGWIKEGEWTPKASAGPPAVVSLSPNSGTGTSVTLRAVYADPNGAGDLSRVLLLMHAGFGGANACYVKYEAQANLLYLANDAGNGWVTPALTPAGAGTASNGQCTLNAGSSSVTTAGNDLTLNVALSFSSAFVGTQNVYLYAAGFSGQNSDWVNKGGWTP